MDKIPLDKIPVGIPVDKMPVGNDEMTMEGHSVPCLSFCLDVGLLPMLELSSYHYFENPRRCDFHIQSAVSISIGG